MTIANLMLYNAARLIVRILSQIKLTKMLAVLYSMLTCRSPLSNELKCNQELMMKKLLIGLMVSAGLISAAYAAGDAEAGKSKVMMCSACHGADGNSPIPNFPKIAGQGEGYIVKQLIDIRDGVRNVPEMVPFVMGVSDQDFADIGAFYAAQKPTNGAAKEELIKLGERVYRGGDEGKGIPACLACHGPSGAGIDLAKYPRLAGQHAAYTQKQLTDFSMGDRANDGEGRIMRDIAERMHTKEIEAVASYIEGLR